MLQQLHALVGGLLDPYSFLLGVAAAPYGSLSGRHPQHVQVRRNVLQLSQTSVCGYSLKVCAVVIACGCLFHSYLL
jgi:hypothetical protein